MPEAVIDALEVVDIHQQQTQLRIFAGGETLLDAADEKRTISEAGQVIGIGQAFDVLLRQLALRDVFVNADVMRELTAFAKYLGNRQLPPVRLQIFAAASEFALPAVAL